FLGEMFLVVLAHFMGSLVVLSIRERVQKSPTSKSSTPNAPSNRNIPASSRHLISMPMLNVLAVRVISFALASFSSFSVAAATEFELPPISRSEAGNVQVVSVASEVSVSLNRPWADNYWRLGRWSLPSVYDVEARYGCSVEKAYDFWPVMGECSGDVV